MTELHPPIKSEVGIKMVHCACARFGRRGQGESQALRCLLLAANTPLQTIAHPTHHAPLERSWAEL